MDNLCKFYKIDDLKHRITYCCRAGCACPFIIGLPRSCAWVIAKQVCKYYEPEPDEKWALFAMGHIGAEVQVSDPFDSEEECRAAICSYMKNIIAKRIK